MKIRCFLLGHKWLYEYRGLMSKDQAVLTCFSIRFCHKCGAEQVKSLRPTGNIWRSFSDYIKQSHSGMWADHCVSLLLAKNKRQAWFCPDPPTSTPI